MFHGYGNTSNSWVCHLLDAAQNHNAVAVAMDYRGTGTAADHRGWFVREGAEDSIFAAKYFLQKFPSIRNVEAFGISMGGNASGLAVAAGAKRPGTNTPLFDYWVNVEGATSMVETYLEAQAVGATGSAFAKNAPVWPPVTVRIVTVAEGATSAPLNCDSTKMPVAPR